MKLAYAGVLFALVALSGCAASSAHMRPATYSAQPPPAGKAAVVFLRPSELGYAIGFEVFDGKGRYLGEALSEKFFETLVDAGEHWFYADAENAGVLKAQLAAGKRYYVVVRPFMGAWSARVELTALAPRSEDWPKLREWLSGSEAQAVDEAAGQSELAARRAEIDEVIAEGNQIWSEADEAWRADHTLLLEDGQETGAPSAPAPAPVPEPATPAAPVEPVAPADAVAPPAAEPSAASAPATPAPAATTPAQPPATAPAPAPAQ